MILQIPTVPTKNLIVDVCLHIGGDIGTYGRDLRSTTDKYELTQLLLELCHDHDSKFCYFGILQAKYEAEIRKIIDILRLN